MPRILYLQYTNPGDYPPLQHSATMLAEQGWDVLFIGVGLSGPASLALPAHARIRHHEVTRTSGGTWGALKYAHFNAAAIAAALRFAPDWCYASDATSAPAALGMAGVQKMRILYHEHDAPGPPTRALVRAARRRLARRADIVVAPSAARLQLLPPGSQPRFVVWNCPRLHEVGPPADRMNTGPFKLVYVGSLSRERLTPQFIDALALLPRHVELHIYGYETAGHRGYIPELMARAGKLQVADRVHYHGSPIERAPLIKALREYQLGISTIVPTSADSNLHTLAGASNKTFEYLAQGLPVLVTADRPWQELYVRPGFALECNPSEASSIADAVGPLTANPERARAMGEAGRAMILMEWNYERQFAPVLAALGS